VGSKPGKSDESRTKKKTNVEENEEEQGLEGSQDEPDDA